MKPPAVERRSQTASCGGSAAATASRNRRSDAIAVICITGLGLSFLWELWAAGSVPFARDMQVYFVPLGRLVWHALQTGNGILWTPFMGNGSPLLANVQSGFFYPPNWLYAILPFLRTFSGLLVAHFVLGGIAMYAFCRRIELSSGPAALAAITYMLGGYFVSLTNLVTVLQVSAWAPLQCLTIVHHLKCRSVRSFLALLFVHLLAFLAGAPLTFALASGMSTAYGLVWIAKRDKDRLRAARFLVVSMGLAAALVTGLSMVQIVPMLEYVSHSLRAGGLPFQVATHYSLGFPRLAEVVIPPSFEDPGYRFGVRTLLTPNVPWLFSVYFGASGIILATCAWRNRSKRAEVLFWAVVALMGAVLSLGRYTPVYGWLYASIPGFSSFRYPERFFVLCGFALPLLAAYGLSAARKDESWSRAWAFLGGGALLIALGVRLFWTLQRDVVRRLATTYLPNRPFTANFELAHETWTGQLDHAIVFLALMIILIGVRRKRLVGEQIFVLLTVGIVALDLWVAHRHLTPVVDRSFYEDTPAIAEILPVEELRFTYRYRAQPVGPNVGRFMTLTGLGLEASKWLWQQTLQPNTGWYYRILTDDSGDAIHLRLEDDERRLLAFLPEWQRERVLVLGSVKYLYSLSLLKDDDTWEAWEAHRLPDPIPGRLYTLRDALPRAYIARRPLFLQDEVQVLNALIAPDFDPSRDVALLAADTAERERTQPGPSRSNPPEGDSSDIRQDGGAGANGRLGGEARIVNDRGGEVRIAVSTSEAGHLVLTDTYYPGWRAFVDGRERPILRANYFYRAVRIAPGDHEVVFRYAPASVVIGACGSLLTLVLLVVGLGVMWWRKPGLAADNFARGPPSGSS